MKKKGQQKRVTLLVNVWLNHLPNSAERPGVCVRACVRFTARHAWWCLLVFDTGRSAAEEMFIGPSHPWHAHHH